MKSLPNLGAIWRWLLTQSYWRFRFEKLGSRAILFKPLLIIGGRYISIGARTSIRDMARLEVIERPRMPWTPRLSIGNGVNIEQGVHIVCQGNVTIGDQVSITPYCVIVDTYHPYDPPDSVVKIGARLPDHHTFVTIGDGSFIGTHSTILPNVTIGKGCVIGAGSIVSCDIPDFAVAAGIPARVLKIFNPKTRKWKVLEK
ncbi:MAG: hypothetical protein NVS3B3_13820 [Aquirhabdus sp.]